MVTITFKQIFFFFYEIGVSGMDPLSHNMPFLLGHQAICIVINTFSRKSVENNVQTDVYFVNQANVIF